MGFLGSILLKYYGRRDLSSQGRKGLFWRAFVQASKTNAIFGLGFFTHADLYSNSDEAEETKKLMAGMDSLSESLEKLMARLAEILSIIRSRSSNIRKPFDESTMAKVKSILESQIGFEKSGDLNLRQQQHVEKS